MSTIASLNANGRLLFCQHVLRIAQGGLSNECKFKLMLQGVVHMDGDGSNTQLAFERRCVSRVLFSLHGMVCSKSVP